jgi:hypothetical protein
VCRYGEGVFMGYRWYTSRDIPVLFPFGHGLGYTTFELGAPTLSATEAPATPDLQVTVRVTVTNTGHRRGSEVVQCYVEPPEGNELRPVRELRAFQKVVLEPGESTEVRLVLGFRSFARWLPAVPGLAGIKEQLSALGVPAAFTPSGPETGYWHVDPGAYQIHLGRSVANVTATLRLRITE